MPGRTEVFQVILFGPHGMVSRGDKFNSFRNHADNTDRQDYIKQEKGKAKQSFQQGSHRLTSTII